MFYFCFIYKVNLYRLIHVIYAASCKFYIIDYYFFLKEPLVVVENEWNLRENNLLKNHGESNNDPNHYSEQATGHHQNKSLIKVKKFDSVACETHGSQNSNFFGLVQEVGTHT